MPSYSLINLSHFCRLPWARSIHKYTHDHACWEYEVTTHYETGWTFIYSGTIQSVKFLLYWFHTLGKEKQKEKCWHRWNEREGPGSSRVIIEIHGNANLPATVASSGTLYEGSYIINTGVHHGTSWQSSRSARLFAALEILTPCHRPPRFEDIIDLMNERTSEAGWDESEWMNGHPGTRPGMERLGMVSGFARWLMGC